MASTNKKKVTVKETNHNGFQYVKKNSHEEELRRAVMSCFLWENNFYESGESISDRIKNLVPKVNPEIVAQIAKTARHIQHLRHVPLLLIREMTRHKTHSHLVSQTLFETISRPDEISEFLSIYWKDGKCPISSQVRKGLGNCFKKFNEYSLAKYRGVGKDVSLRDVLFLTRPKPENKDQEILWKKLANDELETPDTWEVELSKGGDKNASWTRLLKKNKLGSLALLRNLRNMKAANVETKLIRETIKKANHNQTLPFRFIAASKFAPEFESELETALFNSVVGYDKLKGETIILVDVSGSMCQTLSDNSDMTRQDAAYGVAIIAREICENVRVFSFSYSEKEVPNRRGFALAEAIENSQEHGGTMIGHSVNNINNLTKYDRIILITDEESSDGVGIPKCDKAYLLNVASYKNGIAYDKYIHINGFSENVMRYITQIESENNSQVL